MKRMIILMVMLAGNQLSVNSQNWQPFLSADSVTLRQIIASAKYNLAVNPYLSLVGKLATDNSITDSALYVQLSNWAKYPKPSQTGVICRYFIQLDTNYTVPYLVYIPKNYNPAVKTTLLLYFKGGWLSRSVLPAGYPTEIIKDNPTFNYLDSNNVIQVFPALESKLAIYGYQHLQQLVTGVKKMFNIDDNKVFLSGFSDGGKTVYLSANLVPTAFACFYPINAPIVSAPQFPNYTNRPIFSFIAGNDELTHPGSITTKASYAAGLGADWRCRVLPGKKHNYRSYQQEVLPLMFADMKRRLRNPFPTNILYDKTYNDEQFTGIDWIQMNINTKRLPSPWHKTDSVFTLGGEGDTRTYLYGPQTGQLQAVYLNNTFTITTSQVDTVTIYLSPVMVNMQQPVTVVINGKQVYNSLPQYNRKWMVYSFMQHFDREQLWVNKLVLPVLED